MMNRKQRRAALARERKPMNGLAAPAPPPVNAGVFDVQVHANPQQQTVVFIFTLGPVSSCIHLPVDFIDGFVSKVQEMKRKAIAERPRIVMPGQS